MKAIKSGAMLAALFASAFMGLASPAPAQQPFPNPLLYLTGIEHYSTAGGNFVRYRYDVLNKDQYPDALFAAAPHLPPSGTNTNASRTWIDFFDGRTRRRLYGFCALGQAANLGSIWFATPEGTIPPSYVYIEMTDRQTNTKYRSNLADTVM